MLISDYVIAAMEWIGTIAFAISGSLIAIGCSLDLFGVIIVGCTTAVGGGIVRDLLLGSVPPRVFFTPQILLLAIFTSLAVFLAANMNAKRFAGLRKKIETINILFDAIGLASFSVTGVEVACAAGHSDNIILMITLGLLTGVGGGVLRDVFVNIKPYILTKHIYAVASVLGCCVYSFVGIYLDQKVVGTFTAVIVIVMIRLLAAKFHWKLPKIHLNDTVQM